MIGDGYTMVRQCEFAEVPDDMEPDAPPVFCDFDEDDSNPSVETPSTWATDDPNT